MEKFDLYNDISRRTNGDIYVGVVGPVRCGKSTFITKFMKTLVLPNIKDKNEQQRAVDELPQSADGKTIMTTQPRFVPNEAVEIKVDDSTELNVRMIDCVGYLVSGALGHTEGEKQRLVKTPWSEEEMPFEEAAELGTKNFFMLSATNGLIGSCIEHSFLTDTKTKFALSKIKSVSKAKSLLLKILKTKSQLTATS